MMAGGIENRQLENWTGYSLDDDGDGNAVFYGPASRIFNYSVKEILGVRYVSFDFMDIKSDHIAVYVWAWI